MTQRLQLFGAPTVERDGTSFALPFERRNELLAFLALKRAWVGRAELAAMLWPEQERKLAYTNLRKTLFRLQSMPYATGIELDGGAVRFEVETDVAEFELALREQRIADALPLRRGDLLEGFDDDQSDAWTSWLGFERERLNAAWRGAVLTRLHRPDVDPAEGIELSARLLETDPLDEDGLRAHMSCLVRSGQAARARHVYREFVERLADELGLEPSADLKALHDSIGGTTIARPAGSPAPAVAAHDDGFVGRSVELRRIADLLGRDECRLLTIAGPGGMGKTRLAQRALATLAGDFADGAVFIALDDIGSSSEFGGRLAREVGLGPSGSEEPLANAIEFLRDRETLLVLDNFEHLVEDAWILNRVLHACAGVKIVVTSRIRLGLPEEWLLPLEGLPCPEPEDLDRVEAFDAARLFLNAARRVEPALIPSVEARAIVEICSQVDGLPLALELAAAWTRVLSCATIAAELRLGTELLRAVDAAHPARHASIEVVFEQSWRLLTAIERDILARLSIFRGGFTAEAARAVTGASLPVLGALADKSLLRKDDGRLSLHPLVHQLSAIRLGDGDARTETEKAHALYFHRLLGERRRQIESGDRDALGQLDIEFENCRSAWRWAVAHAAIDPLKRSALSLFHFCDHRDRYDEGLALLDEALGADFVGGDRALESLLVGAKAHLVYRLDRYVDAEALATRALAAARTARESGTQALCLQVLGSCSLRLGRHADARRHYDKALQHAVAGGEPRKAAVMLANLALVEKALGRYDEAVRLGFQSMEQYRAVGDVAGEALCLNNLGVLYMTRGDTESCGVHLKAGLAICDRHGLFTTRTLILANLTDLAVQTNDPDAAGYGMRALELARSSGNRALASWVTAQLALIALADRDLSAARAHLATSMELALAVGRPSLQLEGLRCFAEILAAQGEIECARRVLQVALGDPTQSVPERDAIRARLARWPATADAESDPPRIDAREIAHRIVAESSIAYAPLIASLRSNATAHQGA